MQFGTYYFLQATPGRSAAAVITDEVEQMVLSERLGFDSVWLTEHHYADYGISSAPSVLLATVAARTERVKLGTAVYVLPFHHPLKLAEETATLDILKSMAFHNAPMDAVFALGYCGWAPGQLENEIALNGWLTVPYSRELLFRSSLERRYDMALGQLGITRATLSGAAGHA